MLELKTEDSNYFLVFVHFYFSFLFLFLGLRVRVSVTSNCYMSYDFVMVIVT